MTTGRHQPIEELELFGLFESVASEVWRLAYDFPPLARDTLGKQLIRAADSVSANLVEGDARYSDADAVHFFVIARASARETRLWLRRSMERQLVPQETGERLVTQLMVGMRLLNALIHYRRKNAKAARIKEDPSPYDMERNLEAVDFAEIGNA